jgi:hypothetical protein
MSETWSAEVEEEQEDHHEFHESMHLARTGYHG